VRLSFHCVSKDFQFLILTSLRFRLFSIDLQRVLFRRIPVLVMNIL
jgi:hypothetical protein